MHNSHRRILPSLALFVVAVLVAPGAPRAAGIDLPAHIDFQDFTGSGLAPGGFAGGLDSEYIAVSGLSEGDTFFGGTYLEGDYARGSSPGGVTSGGIYAFDTAQGVALGFQPTASDFSPGALVFRFVNSTATPVQGLRIEGVLGIRNDGDRSSALGLEIADLDQTALVEIDLLDTAEGADPAPTWASFSFDRELTGVVLDPGAVFHVRLTSEDLAGGGSRDELGLLEMHVTPVSEPGLIKGQAVAGLCLLCGAGWRRRWLQRLHPFTLPTGERWATRREIPASSAAAVTECTSL